MTLAVTFSFPRGDGSQEVQDSGHNDLYECALTSGPCPLRDSEGTHLLLPWVHTGKAEGWVTILSGY